MKRTAININPNSLIFLKSLLIEHKLYLIGDLEIEPFVEFSTEFSSEYWYIKYYLLREGEFFLDEEGVFHFLNQEYLNIIFITVTDKNNFLIKCIDGDWYIEEYDKCDPSIINTVNKKINN